MKTYKRKCQQALLPPNNNKLANIYLICHEPGIVPRKHFPGLLLFNLPRNPMGCYSLCPRSLSLKVEKPSFELNLTSGVTSYLLYMLLQFQAAPEFQQLKPMMFPYELQNNKNNIQRNASNAVKQIRSDIKMISRFTTSYQLFHRRKIYIYKDIQGVTMCPTPRAGAGSLNRLHQTF